LLGGETIKTAVLGITRHPSISDALERSVYQSSSVDP
jgi:hypothetical protein